MGRKTKIEKALLNQKKIEGNTPETALLLKVVKLVKWESEWNSMSKVKWVDRVRFHYPTPLLLSLQDLFKEEKK